MPSGFKTTQKEFIAKAIEIHGDKFDYTKSIYVNNKTPLCIVCLECKSDFYKRPDVFLYQKQGCPKCTDKVYNTEQFIDKATRKHGKNYDYSNVVYVNALTKVSLLCNECNHNFYQKPSQHLFGQGCPNCSHNIPITTEEFIKRAQKIHGDLYDYRDSIYGGSFEPVKIYCKACKVYFHQKPISHIHHKNGCTFCVNGGKSNIESDWFKKLNIENQFRHKKILIDDKFFIVDALVGNTVYEFYGSFWHGDPRKFKHNSFNSKVQTSFGELYQKTIERYHKILEAGYEVKFIWEYDYKNGMLFSDAHPSSILSST